MAEPLTQLESQVYHFLIDFLAENTYQPSIREIARQFRIKSTKTVSDLLQSLEGKGYIQRDHSRSRGVRLLGYAASGTVQPIACYARVEGAPPPLRDENRKGFITMDRRFLPTPDVFWLKAVGSGMAARGILDGDYVMVSPSTRPNDGDTVAVRIGLSATLKTLTHRDMTILLESGDGDNGHVELAPTDDFAILGVVCAVFRPYFEQEGAPLKSVAEAVVS